MEKRGVYYIRWYNLGKERLRSTGTANKVEAEAALVDFRSDGALPDMGFKREVEQVVYFIGAEGGGVKIGVASDPQRRLKQMQTGSSAPLSLLAVTGGGRKTEYVYHALFHQYRISGEWFARHPEVMNEIDRLNAALQS